jgi:hypothetical protein
MGRKAKAFRDTTQIDRKSGSLHSVFSRQTDGSNHLRGKLSSVGSEVFFTQGTLLFSHLQQLSWNGVCATLFIIAFY